MICFIFLVSKNKCTYFINLTNKFRAFVSFRERPWKDLLQVPNQPLGKWEPQDPCWWLQWSWNLSFQLNAGWHPRSQQQCKVPDQKNINFSMHLIQINLLKAGTTTLHLQGPQFFPFDQSVNHLDKIRHLQLLEMPQLQLLICQQGHTKA